MTIKKIQISMIKKIGHSGYIETSFYILKKILTLGL